MKKFVFPLQKVLEYKSHMEEYEKNVLAQMRVKRVALIQEAEGIKRRQQCYRNDYEDGCRAGITVREITVLYQDIENLQEKWEEKLAQIQDLEAEIEAQVGKVLELSREKTSMEKLKQKYIDAYRHAEEKSAEALIEDFVGNQKFASEPQAG